MAKVKLPETGILKNQEESQINAQNKLKEILKVTLDIPFSFDNRAYLTSLSSKIEGYIKNNLDLEETLTQTDNNFRKVDEEIDSNFSKFDKIKIPKRNQMI